MANDFVVTVEQRRQIETIIKPKVDISIINTKTRARGFKGWCEGCIAKARKTNNLELIALFQEVLRRYEKYHSRTIVPIEGWRGKSTIEIIQRPDSFDIVKYRRKDKESEPEKVVYNVTKEDVNKAISAINLSSHEIIDTKIIAENFCKVSNLFQNTKGRNLFEDDGKFDWDMFFSDRFMHTHLNYILELLDYYKLIKYVGGKSEVLNRVANIQTILKC